MRYGKSGVFFGSSLAGLLLFSGCIAVNDLSVERRVNISASSELPFEPAFLAADSDVATFWSPKPEKESSLTVDLLEPQVVASVHFTWYPAKACNYVLDISLDGTNWQKVADGEVEGQEADRVDLDSPVSARYLRLRQSGWRKGLSELKVNGRNVMSREFAAQFQPVPEDAPYLDPKRSADERAANALALMTDYEKHQFVSGYRRFYIRPLNRLGLRAVYFMDASAGVHLRPELDESELGSIAYPSSAALAATWNPELAADYARSIAKECRVLGADVLLGPGFNLYRTAANGRNFEYMGEDPVLATKMAVPYIEAMQAEDVIATAKHFICNNHEWRRHSTDVVVDDRALHEVYMYPWYAVVHQADVAAVMTSYNWMFGEKVGQSPKVINGLLREDVGFDGLSMSDWGAVKDAKKVLTSGQDLIMEDIIWFPDFYAESLETTMKHIDKMVLHILTPLFEYGVYDRARKDPDYMDAADRSACEATALRTAREAIVLLKNEGDVLPLVNTPVLVMGPDAESTERYAGMGSGRVEGYGHTFVGPELRQLLGTEQVVSADWKTVDDETIRNAPSVVLCVGQTQGEETDHPMHLDSDQQDLIARCAALNPKTVVVVNSGSGLEMKWADSVAGIVWAWFGGQYSGTATADVLTGAVNPSGKMPFTIEQNMADAPSAGYRPSGSSLGHFPDPDNEVDQTLPDVVTVEYKEGVFTGHRWYDKKDLPVRYPFGFGLSYTAFEYSDLQTAFRDGGIEVAATVRNAGRRAGDEIVQVYVGDDAASVERPLRELKAFRRVSLKPGESKTVTFMLRPIDLAFYDVTQENWKVEPGVFSIDIAASSRDIRLTKKINWTEELRYQRPSDAAPLEE